MESLLNASSPGADNYVGNDAEETHTLPHDHHNLPLEVNEQSKVDTGRDLPTSKGPAESSFH